LSVGPLSGEGLLVSLHLPVSLGCAGWDSPGLDGVSGEQLSEAAVVDVGEVVVGLQPSGRDPVAGEELQGAFNEGGDGGGLLVVVQLAVGQAGVVIDDRVAELPAGPVALLLGGPVALPGDPVPRPGEPPRALDVHLQ